MLLMMLAAMIIGHVRGLLFDLVAVRLLNFNVGGHLMVWIFCIFHRELVHDVWLGEIVVASVTILNVSIAENVMKINVYFAQ